MLRNGNDRKQPSEAGSLEAVDGSSPGGNARMKYIWYGFFILVQCTWGFFQTLAGFVVFLIHAGKPHAFFRGCISTKWDSGSGLSLGLFLFSPDESCYGRLKYPNETKEQFDGRCGMILVHEYGHAMQSFVLGPFHLIPGICSFGWAHLKRYVELRRKYGVPYSYCWVEHWANVWGEKATGLPSIGRLEMPEAYGPLQS
jgi:hypothetical protein